MTASLTLGCVVELTVDRTGLSSLYRNAGLTFKAGLVSMRLANENTGRGHAHSPLLIKSLLASFPTSVYPRDFLKMQGHATLSVIILLT